ncbi:MAG: hypothetical protein AAGI63_06835 [Planctomycetota bacterium]
MKSIRLSCPSCERELELPATAVGRLAQCPACQATFRVASDEPTDANVISAIPVPEPPTPPTTQDAATPEPPDEPGTASTVDSYWGQPLPERNQGVPVQQATAEPTQQTEAPQPSDQTNAEPIAAPDPHGRDLASHQNQAEPNPFTSPLESGMAAPMPNANPYESTSQNIPVSAAGGVPIVHRGFEQIFSPTMSIYGNRLGQLLLGFLLTVIIGFLGFYGWAYSLISIDESIGDPVTSILGLASLPFVIFFACFLTVGLTRHTIAIARNSPSPFREFLPPLRIVLRFLAGGLLLMLGLGALGGLGALMLDVIIPAIFSEQVVIAISIITVFGSTVLAMALYWILWAWVFIVSDGRASIVGAFRASLDLTRHNRMTSLLMVIAGVTLTLAGAASCYVGMLLTVPLANLMFAVGYLLMTNQSVQVANDPPPDTRNDDFWQ